MATWPTIDGRPGGWVNASRKSDYSLFSSESGSSESGPEAGSVIGVSCFVIAPPYRRHGIAARLLDRVIADAPGRGARFVEAYPFNEAVVDDPGSDFRGPRKLYEERGFEEMEVKDRHTVMRRGV